MSSTRRFIIVFNPVAGGRRAELAARRAADRMRDSNHAVELQGTLARRHAEDIASDVATRNDGTCIVACGGDGTIQEVVNGVAGIGAKQTPIGILPTGRCNDFARALGISGNMDDSIRVLLGGHTRDVDLGRVNGRLFCTVSAIGFDAVVSRYVNDHRLPFRGTLAYVYATLAALWRYRLPEFSVEGDFETYRGPVFLVATANTCSYGGAMRIAPDANPFDGVLNVCLVTRISRFRVMALLPRVMAGRHTHLPQVHMLTTRRITISPTTDDDAWEVWADGEPVGTLPATIESVPAAASFVLPGPAA